MQRFERELDIATYFKRMRRNYYAVKVLFTKMERYLIQNNKVRVLPDTFTTTSSESDVISPWDEDVNWND